MVGYIILPKGFIIKCFVELSTISEITFKLDLIEVTLSICSLPSGRAGLPQSYPEPGKATKPALPQGHPKTANPRSRRPQNKDPVATHICSESQGSPPPSFHPLLDLCLLLRGVLLVLRGILRGVLLVVLPKGSPGLARSRAADAQAPHANDAHATGSGSSDYEIILFSL